MGDQAPHVLDNVSHLLSDPTLNQDMTAQLNASREENIDGVRLVKSVEFPRENSLNTHEASIESQHRQESPNARSQDKTVQQIDLHKFPKKTNSLESDTP